MVGLWALVILIALVTPAYSAVTTVTSTDGGKIEICEGRDLSATLSAVVYGTDWSGSVQTGAKDLETPPVSARQRSLEGHFGRWGPQASFREVLEAGDDGELSVSYEWTARTDLRVNAAGVSISLPRSRYAGTTVVAYTADGVAAETASLPRPLTSIFLLGQEDVGKVEVAPGTPQAFTLVLSRPVRVGIQDNLAWGGSDYELRLNALPAGPSRELAAGMSFSLPFTIVFPAPVTFALDPALNVSQSDTAEWIPYSLPWDKAAVDLSWLNERPAGGHGFVGTRDGHFVFEDGTPVRFWGAVIAASACFPTHDHADAMAERMAKLGINLVRLTHLDAFWNPVHLFSHDYGDTQHYDPEMFDRLDYLIFSLKQHGIYVYLDNLVSRRFTEEDGVVNARELPMAARPYALFDPTIIALEKRYSHDLWSHVNAYTGLAYKDDPVIAMTDVLNENDLNIADVTVEPYASNFEALWREWAADNQVDPDQPVGSTLERGPDVLRFVDWLQRGFYADMHAYLRELGVRVPITGNAWLSSAANYPSQVTMDFLDAHAYWDHPSDDYRRCLNVPELGVDPLEGGSTLAELTMSKVEGKPMVVSEWGHPWPNEYRLEGPLWKSAIGSLQGWDAMLAFEYAGTADIEADYLAGPFDVCSDPEVLGLFPAAALLFRRGDVRQSPEPTAVRWTEDQIFHAPPYVVFRGQPAYRALVEATTLVTSLGTPEGVDRVVSPLDSPPTVGTTLTRADTGEFRRDWQAGVAVIDAPRSQGAFGRLEDAGTVQTSDVSVRSETPFAAIVVTSMDGRPVRESRHLLVTAVGRAENTGQVFNMTRTELKELGAGPILVEPVTGRVTISTDRDAFTAYALDADGTRRSLGERRALSEAITLDIIQASRTIYYELESVE